MKILKILFLLQIFGVIILLAQDIKSVNKFFKDNNIEISAVNDSIDIDPYSFFPAHVGDFWQYNTAGNVIQNTTITKDSLLDDGSRLLYYDDYYFQWPTYRIDTNYNVFYHPFHQRGNDLWYKLDANLGDRWWIERDSVDGEFIQGYIGAVDSIYQGFYLGIHAIFKVISKYLVYNNNGKIEEFWDSDKVLATGMGLVYEDKDGVQPDILIAAIINSDTLGTIVGISDRPISTFPNMFSLSQNYPNPFNSSTSIEYTIQEAGNYKFIIVNVLGELVRIVKKKYYKKGSYKVNLDFSGLASGVYLGILTNQKTTKQIKMIYLK